MRAENWLKLDADFYDDDKLIEMELTLGKAACYVYMMLVGKLRMAENYELPTNYRTLAVKVRATEPEVKSIIEDFDLFLIDRQAGLFTSARLLRDMEVKDAGREERAFKAKKAADTRWASKNNFAETKSSTKQSEDAVAESDSQAIASAKSAVEQEHSFGQQSNFSCMERESDLQNMPNDATLCSPDANIMLNDANAMLNDANAMLTACSGNANAMLTDAKKERKSIEREFIHQEYIQDRRACAQASAPSVQASQEESVAGASASHSPPPSSQAGASDSHPLKTGNQALEDEILVLEKRFPALQCENTTTKNEIQLLHRHDQNKHSETAIVQTETQLNQMQNIAGTSIYDKYVRDYCYPTDGILEHEIFPLYPRKCTQENKVKYLFRNMRFTPEQMQKLIQSIPLYAEYIKQTGTIAVNLFKYLTDGYWDTDWPEQQKQQLEIQANMRARQATTSPPQANKHEHKMLAKSNSDQQLNGIHEDTLFQKLIDTFPNVDSPAQAYTKWVLLSDKHKQAVINTLPDYIDYYKACGHEGYILANFLDNWNWNKDWKVRTEALWKRRKENSRGLPDAPQPFAVALES